MDRYRRNRARSRQLFALLSDDAYYSQPIALRHPIVFYEGHLPGFSFNTLVKKALGGPSIDARLERLFARGIDPHESTAAGSHTPSLEDQWPSREVVRAFAAEADRLVIDALEHADIERPGHPLLDRGEAVFAILEHEEMHHETLLYMWHRLPFAQKTAPAGYQPRIDGARAPAQWVHVPAGRATLGVDRTAIPFGWDNECPACVGRCAELRDRAARCDQRAVSRVRGGRRLPRRAMVDAGRLDSGGRPKDWTHPLFWERIGDAWFWRGMFGLIPLPASWPVYVSQAEASAFARWRGARLPTEGEFQRAAYGSPGGERQYPWGGDAPTPRHGVFDFASWDPEPAGSHPDGASAWGVEDLVGNGWEWTGTAFAPFPGFREIASYPEYSADFFDGEHFVMKGASPATVRDLLRPTFRNWFRKRYPYVYATFRCVKSE